MATYTIAVPIQGQNISASLFGAAVRNAINDLDARMLQVESIAIARVSRSTLVLDSATFTTTEFQWTSLAGGLIQGYTYQVWFNCAISSTVANDQIQTRIREDNSAGTQISAPLLFTPGTSAVGWPVQGLSEYTALTTLTKTFSFTGQRSTGTGTYQIRAGASRPTYAFIDLVMVP